MAANFRQQALPHAVFQCEHHGGLGGFQQGVLQDAVGYLADGPVAFATDTVADHIRGVTNNHRAAHAGSNQPEFALHLLEAEDVGHEVATVVVNGSVTIQEDGVGSGLNQQCGWGGVVWQQAGLWGVVALNGGIGLQDRGDLTSVVAGAVFRLG